MFRVRIFAFAFCACGLGVTAGLAQSNLASISGIVTDPQNAVVPQANVTAANVETGVQTRFTTNSAGFYHLQNLPIGLYDLSVEHSGFRKYIREGITLTTGEQLGLDIKLELGSTGQSVTVSGEAPLIRSFSTPFTAVVNVVGTVSAGMVPKVAHHPNAIWSGASRRT
jgi:hypothetical protein